MYGFEQASSIWMSVQPSGPAASAQSNWMAAAAEARQLADELLKNVQTLLSYWKGPAATEFSKSMQTLAGFRQHKDEQLEKAIDYLNKP